MNLDFFLPMVVFLPSIKVECGMRNHVKMTKKVISKTFLMICEKYLEFHTNIVQLRRTLIGYVKEMPMLAKRQHRKKPVFIYFGSIDAGEKLD